MIADLKVGDWPRPAAAPDGASEITFMRDPDGRTYIGRQRMTYPFHICRALSVAGDPVGMATLYVQSVAGGIFEHGRLGETITAEEGAAAHVTTQASTIVHSMEDGSANQQIQLIAAKDAFLEFLPDPLILFPKARLATNLRIRAHETATVIAGDSFLFHDPNDENSMFDWLDATMEIVDSDGTLSARDRVRLTGAMVMEGRPGITGRFGVQGSLYVVSRARPAARFVEVLREAVAGAAEDVYVGASELPGNSGAWLRVLSDDVVALRATLNEAWARLRLLLTGRRPMPRRK